ncbi:MAG: hypothetical protein IV100_28530 [Myxococcales bacterium]|nr:hypothetical protein [Myxococcales bacterium]
MLAYTTLLASTIVATHDAPRHLALDIHLGVPYPISTYGYESTGEDSTLDVAIDGGVGLRWYPYPFEDLSLGLTGSGATIDGATDGVDGYLYYGSLSLEVGWDFALGQRWSLAATGGPSVLWTGFVLDDVLQEHTVHVGGRVGLRVHVGLTPMVSLFVGGALGLYGSPTERETFFNEPLAEMYLVFVHGGVTVILY